MRAFWNWLRQWLTEKSYTDRAFVRKACKL